MNVDVITPTAAIHGDVGGPEEEKEAQDLGLVMTMGSHTPILPKNEYGYIQACMSAWLVH